MTDLNRIHRECQLIAVMISRGDTAVAQPKINKLIADYPHLAGNIRLNLTNCLLDIITSNVKEVPDEADDVLDQVDIG